jgi:hypothetical protein
MPIEDVRKRLSELEADDPTALYLEARELPEVQAALEAGEIEDLDELIKQTEEQRRLKKEQLQKQIIAQQKEAVTPITSIDYWKDRIPAITLDILSALTPGPGGKIGLGGKLARGILGASVASDIFSPPEFGGRESVTQGLGAAANLLRIGARPLAEAAQTPEIIRRGFGLMMRHPGTTGFTEGLVSDIGGQLLGRPAEEDEELNLTPAIIRGALLGGPAYWAGRAQRGIARSAPIRVERSLEKFKDRGFDASALKPRAEDILSFREQFKAQDKELMKEIKEFLGSFDEKSPVADFQFQFIDALRQGDLDTAGSIYHTYRNKMLGKYRKVYEAIEEAEKEKKKLTTKAQEYGIESLEDLPRKQKEIFKRVKEDPRTFIQDELDDLFHLGETPEAQKTGIIRRRAQRFMDVIKLFDRPEERKALRSGVLDFVINRFGGGEFGPATKGVERIYNVLSERQVNIFNELFGPEGSKNLKALVRGLSDLVNVQHPEWAGGVVPGAGVWVRAKNLLVILDTEQLANLVLGRHADDWADSAAYARKLLDNPLSAGQGVRFLVNFLDRTANRLGARKIDLTRPLGQSLNIFFGPGEESRRFREIAGPQETEVRLYEPGVPLAPRSEPTSTQNQQ